MIHQAIFFLTITLNCTFDTTKHRKKFRAESLFLTFSYLTSRRKGLIFFIRFQRIRWRCNWSNCICNTARINTKRTFCNGCKCFLILHILGLNTFTFHFLSRRTRNKFLTSCSCRFLTSEFICNCCNSCIIRFFCRCCCNVSTSSRLSSKLTCNFCNVTINRFRNIKCCILIFNDFFCFIKMQGSKFKLLLSICFSFSL